MQTPPEVIFKDIDRSPWVEELIAQRCAHLEKFSQEITRCHVTLSQEPKHHDLAVKKQKEIVDMQTQLPAVINEAFTAIEKQLKKAVALRRHDEKPRVNGQPHGTVEKIFEDEGYGFIRTIEEGPQASSVQVVARHNEQA